MHRAIGLMGHSRGLFAVKELNSARATVASPGCVAARIADRGKVRKVTASERQRRGGSFRKGEVLATPATSASAPPISAPYCADDGNAGLDDADRCSRSCTADEEIIDEAFVRVWLTQNQIAGQVRKLASESRGSRLVQLALQIAAFENDNVLKALILELQGWVQEAVNSPHANHVLQKAIEFARPSSLPFVIPELMACFCNSAEIAKHQFGCRVLERLLEHFPPPALREIVDGIVKDTRTVEELSKNMFASFVLQHMMEHGEPGSQRKIVEAVSGRFLEAAAKNQHARGVLDKVLTYASPRDQRILATKLVDGGLVLELGLARAPGCDAAIRLFHVLPKGCHHWNTARKQISDHIGQVRKQRHAKELLNVSQIDFDDVGSDVVSICTRVRFKSVDDVRKERHESTSYSSSAGSTPGSPLLGTSPPLGASTPSTHVKICGIHQTLTDLQLPPNACVATDAFRQKPRAPGPVSVPPGVFMQRPRGFSLTLADNLI
jgi:hypothetical protein